MEEKKDIYKFSRFLYIIEAALEYFVALSIGSVYLAKVTAYLGLSDGLTGILSAFVSLGCGFQLIAIFLVNKQPVKHWVTAGHMVSQLFFAFIFIVPVVNLSLKARTVIFVIILLSAHIIHNVVNSPKINWYMSLVDDDKRGRFTANKEIVSLITGMAFSYGFAAIIDYFEARGDMRTALIFCGIAVFGLMVLHSVTLILSKEKPAEKKEKRESTAASIKELFKNKMLRRIIFLFMIWNVAAYSTMAFVGTYQTKELGFSMTYASIIIMIGSFARVILSRVMGRFADKFSFAKMLTVSYAIVAIAFGINIFTVPQNGKVFYAVFYALYCICMAGVSSSAINLIYDYVKPEQRTQAFALNQTTAGITGFLTTLAVSPLVSYIQNNGNRFFGLSVYAQQVTSAFSFIVTVLLVVYMLIAVCGVKRPGEDAEK